MRVAFLLLDSGVGGGQRVALNVAEQLLRRGDEVGVIAPSPGPATIDFSELGALAFFVDVTTLRRPQGVLRAAAIVRKYSILYSHTSSSGQVLASLTARLAGRPHVAHQHTYPRFSPRQGIQRLQAAIYWRALAGTHFIAVAEHVKQGLLDRGIRPERVRVVANGVSIPGSEMPEPSPPQLRVGMLGRFDPGKGMHNLILAAKSIGQKSSIKFVIGGHSGPFIDYETQIRQDAYQVDVEIVDATNQGFRFLSHLDVVVIPSRYEGSPLVLLEAMALGKPIVASDIPGISGTIEHNQSGLLVPPDDAPALAQAILRLVTDPETRARLARGARNRAVHKYSLDRSVESIVNLLRRVVKNDK